jgi:hypothetical protein
VGAVDSEGSYAWMWKLSVPSPQFCCNPKTALRQLNLYLFEMIAHYVAQGGFEL